MKIEKEYSDIYARWKQKPDKDNTAELLRAVDPVINSALRGYAGDMVSSPIVKSKARRLAVEAFAYYDPAKGKLKSHILNRLQRLRRTAASARQIIQMPEQVAMTQYQINEAAKFLEEEHGRPPSDQQLADYTGISLRRLENIRRGIKPVAEGRFSPEFRTEGSEYYEPGVTSLNKNYDAWIEFIYTDQAPTNQYIMERVLGLHGHKPIPAKDVAKKLKMTPSAVSQRIAEIQKQLNELGATGIF